MATKRGEDQEVNVGCVIVHSEDHCKPEIHQCESSDTREDCRVPVDVNMPKQRSDVSDSKRAETLVTDMHVRVDDIAQENSLDKSQRHRGLQGRRLKAPSFKRRKRRSEPGTPSDSDSSDTKERRRQNVTLADWPAWKVKKARLEVASSRRVEEDAPIADSDSPSPKHPA